MSAKVIQGAEAARVRELHAQNMTLLQIAEAVSAEFGVARRKQTIWKFVQQTDLRNARSDGRKQIKERLRKLFTKGLTAKAASHVLQAEMGYHLSIAGVHTAWRSMGLRRGHRPPPVPYRGRLPIPQHAPPLVRQFFKELNAQQTTMSEVGERAGLRRRTIAGWGTARTPSLSNFEAALNVLDLELVIQPRAEP